MKYEFVLKAFLCKSLIENHVAATTFFIREDIRTLILCGKVLFL